MVIFTDGGKLVYEEVECCEVFNGIEHRTVIYLCQTNTILSTLAVVVVISI